MHAATAPLAPGAGRRRWRPGLALVLNALIWGTSWWPFRQLHEQAGLHPLWTTAGIYLMAVVAIAGSRPAAMRQVLRAPALWLIVLASGTTNATFNWGVTVGDVVRVVLLFYLMPLWAVLLARLMLNETLTRAAMLRVAMALVGAVIVLWPQPGHSLGPLRLTDALGLIGGFSFALNNVLLRREARRSESSRALAMFFGGTVVSGGLALVLGPQQVPWPSPLAPGWLLFALALGSLFLLSNLALQYGAARLPANATAVIMLTEVVFASVSALALGAGSLTPALAIGGALIVGAAALAAWHP
ncbi:MAG TPA: DMT family transporter [Ideonella sp.]|jgi:drug/metabolite transporter (DMT)-like permease|nr:DMT family transporter [Ideonella sp.]